MKIVVKTGEVSHHTFSLAMVILFAASCFICFTLLIELMEARAGGEQKMRVR